jgi:hypothetical protein
MKRNRFLKLALLQVNVRKLFVQKVYLTGNHLALST